MSENTLFAVRNHHSAQCGMPPRADGDNADIYVGYFENEHGEQCVFTYYVKTGVGQIRMGDAGWERAHDVVNGEAPTLVMKPHERAWLQACWVAATRRAGRSVA